VVVVEGAAMMMLDPRTAPTCGEMMLYIWPLVVQLRVTSCPAAAVAGFAVKLEIVGEAPLGTLAGV